MYSFPLSVFDDGVVTPKANGSWRRPARAGAVGVETCERVGAALLQRSAQHITIKTGRIISLAGCEAVAMNVRGCAAYPMRQRRLRPKNLGVWAAHPRRKQ